MSWGVCGSTSWSPKQKVTCDMKLMSWCQQLGTALTPSWPIAHLIDFDQLTLHALLVVYRINYPTFIHTTKHNSFTLISILTYFYSFHIGIHEFRKELWTSSSTTTDVAWKQQVPNNDFILCFIFYFITIVSYFISLLQFEHKLINIWLGTSGSGVFWQQQQQ